MRYKGRGYIQLTGRANYRDYGNRLGVDLENNPDLAKDPNIAADIAIAYWQQRVDRNAARAGDVRTVTRNINGGLNGLADRQNKFNKYMKEKGTLSIKKFDPTKSYKAGDMVIKNDKVMRHDGFGFAELVEYHLRILRHHLNHKYNLHLEWPSWIWIGKDKILSWLMINLHRNNQVEYLVNNLLLNQ